MIVKKKKWNNRPSNDVIHQTFSLGQRKVGGKKKHKTVSQVHISYLNLRSFFFPFATTAQSILITFFYSEVAMSAEDTKMVLLIALLTPTITALPYLWVSMQIIISLCLQVTSIIFVNGKKSMPLRNGDKRKYFDWKLKMINKGNSLRKHLIFPLFNKWMQTSECVY